MEAIEAKMAEMSNVLAEALTQMQPITIHMPRKWNLSSSEKCNFRKTRANRILI